MNNLVHQFKWNALVVIHELTQAEHLDCLMGSGFRQQETECTCPFHLHLQLQKAI